MADFNQKKPGETLSDISTKQREKLISRNTYKKVDGDPKGKGNAKYLSVYDNDNTGGSLDILGNGEPNTGRIGNLKNNLYSNKKEYSSGNLDSGDGYVPSEL